MSLSNKNVRELVGWLVLEKNKIEKRENDSSFKSAAIELIDNTVDKIACLNDIEDYDPKTGVHGMAKLKEYFNEFVEQSRIVIDGREEKDTNESLNKAFDGLVSDFEYLTTSNCIVIPNKIEEFLRNMSVLYRHVRKNELDILYMDMIYSEVLVAFSVILDQVQ